MVVHERLPLVSLKQVSQEGLTEQEIDRLIIPQRTRRHRADKNQPLTVEESDRTIACYVFKRSPKTRSATKARLQSGCAARSLN